MPSCHEREARIRRSFAARLSSWSGRRDQSRCASPGCASVAAIWSNATSSIAENADDGLTSAEREELRQLRKRVKRVEQERDILKRAAVLFAAETETR